METLFEELKRYVGFDGRDEAALRAVYDVVSPEFERISVVFYDRILSHSGARAALEGGESQVGQLKITLKAWLDSLFRGPWDEAYFERRCRIGRVHVRIALPQHYMFGAMNVIRAELTSVLERHFVSRPGALADTLNALGKILDLELAIMLHTYREDLIAQQAKSERLSTFGQLVGSIGHELRNPLGVIESSMFILKGRITDDERAKKHVDRIYHQLGLANDIISALLDMIRDRPLERAQVSLPQLLDSIRDAVALPPGVQLVFDGVDALPPVSGDPLQLRQVLFNLVDNAVHAVGTSGDVRVAGSRNGGVVQIAVEDSGPGVDAETRRRLFEPLVTTKTKGIGLGLALVKRIVERHGGTVHYEARAPRGARFVVRLPEGSSHA